MRWTVAHIGPVYPKKITIAFFVNQYYVTHQSNLLTLRIIVNTPILDCSLKNVIHLMFQPRPSFVAFSIG